MKLALIPLVLVLAIVGVAIAIRVPNLGLRPMHADEAVQAARFRDLWQRGKYVYDPNEFHGPTLTYATYPFAWLGDADRFARTTKATYRAVPTVFGILLVLLMLAFHDALGGPATLWAAFLAAVSPAMVFYSRYYIHETLLAFFTLMAIVCLWRYVRTGKLVWAIAIGASVGLMQATNDTAAIAYLAAGTALAATALWAWRSARSSSAAHGPGHVNQQLAALRQRAKWWHLTVTLLVAAAVASILLSSFLANPRGPLDGVTTYLPWLRRAGGASTHVHPWYFYLHRLGWWRSEGTWPWTEGLVGALGIVGIIVGMIGRRNGLGTPQVWFTRWLGFHTLLLTFVYSAIPYKTPWCLMQFWIGWILLAGIGAAAVVRAARPKAVRSIVVSCLLMGIAGLAWQAYQASYVKVADVHNPYVYAQTSFGVEKLARQLDALALSSSTGNKTPIKVIWHDAYYWPLPWYLRRFEDTEFWTCLPEDPEAPIIVASPQYDAQLTDRLGRDYLMTDYFELRPRVLAQLWVRFDLWEAHLKRLGRL